MIARSKQFHGAVVCILLGYASCTLAYVGPGAGLSALGIVIGMLAAIVLGIAGFIWYPVKRLLRARQARAKEQAAATNVESSRREESASEES